MDTNFWLLVAILGAELLILLRGPGGDPSRLRSLERKLDLMLAQLGINPQEGVDSQLKELLQNGQKIEAIKLYRQQSGVGLKEAKDYIESHYGA